jgi:hypothetical protein
MLNNPLMPGFNPLFRPFPTYNPGFFNAVPTYFPSFSPSYFPAFSSPRLPTFSLMSLPSLANVNFYDLAPRTSLRNTEVRDDYDRGYRREVVMSTPTAEGYPGDDRLALASDADSENTRSPVYRTIVTSMPTGAHAPRSVSRPIGKRVTPPTQKELESQGAPIWKPFMARFKQCARHCEPTGYHTWGGRGNASCHPEGLAIDISGMYCSDDGRHYGAKDRWDRFQEMVECMKTKMLFSRIHRNGRREIISGVLYRENKNRGETRDHWDHAHFSLGCQGGWVY